MPDYPLKGGCHCGAVRYSIDRAPESIQHCHCSQCRKLFGTLFAQGAVIDRNAIHIEGEEKLRHYESSPGFVYSFCPTCSSLLFARSSLAEEAQYFMPATLDGGVHPGHPPDKEAHTFVASRAQWDHFNDHLPRYDDDSPDEIPTEMMSKEA